MNFLLKILLISIFLCNFSAADEHLVKSNFTINDLVQKNFILLEANVEINNENINTVFIFKQEANPLGHSMFICYVDIKKKTEEAPIDNCFNITTSIKILKPKIVNDILKNY